MCPAVAMGYNLPGPAGTGLDAIRGCLDYISILMNIWAEPYSTKAGICVPKAGYDVKHERSFVLDRPRGYRNDHIVVNFTSEIEILDRNGRSIYPKGACIIYGPGDCQWYAATGSTFSHHWLHMNGAGVKPLIERTGLPLRTVFHCANEAIAPLFARIVVELSSRDDSWDFLVETLVAQLLWEMSRGRRHATGRAGKGITTVDKLSDIRLAMYENPQWNWNLRSIARKACLSVSRFVVVYGKRFGESPMSDLMAARIQRASWLLTHTTDPIKEIAHAVGIEDQAYLCRVFSKRTGMAPSKYRRQRGG